VNPAHGSYSLPKAQKRKLKPVVIEIDGAARGNPGPAGAGVLLLPPDKPAVERAFYLGESTNNVAETVALILALQEAFKQGWTDLSVRTDSQLLANQVTGHYKVKDKRLQWLHVIIRHLLEGCTSFSIRHIPREKNKRADKLANQAVNEGNPRASQLTLF